MQGNGKTTIASNLAILVATSGHKMVLVDADMRRSAIHTAFDIEKNPGLSDIIRGKKEAPEVVRSMNSMKVNIITAGDVPSNVTEVVGSKRIAEILSELKDEFETIIVDAPPLVISDSYNLASKVDGVIIVLEQGQTREDQAKVIKEQLTRAGARVIGVVFNRVTEKIAKSNGDYQYLAMYSPHHYNDYVSRSPKPKESQEPSPTKKLLAFFEHGDVPPDVTESLEGAFDKFQEQRERLRGRFRKTAKPVNNKEK
jgi:capsular exopolysaccharide synthesis family protein